MRGLIDSLLTVIKLTSVSSRSPLLADSDNTNATCARYDERNPKAIVLGVR